MALPIKWWKDESTEFTGGSCESWSWWLQHPTPTFILALALTPLDRDIIHQKSRGTICSIATCQAPVLRFHRRSS